MHHICPFFSEEKEKTGDRTGKPRPTQRKALRFHTPVPIPLVEAGAAGVLIFDIQISPACKF
ncbi:MAG: hypothetical protein C4292_01760 [Nitrososphaera sp.]